MNLPAYAFPRRLPDVELHPDDALQCIKDHAGMTLRDYFAAKAMQAYVSAYPCQASEEPECIAADAYELADAMLKAREA